MNSRAKDNPLLGFLAFSFILVHFNIARAHILPTKTFESVIESVPGADRNEKNSKQNIPRDVLILRGKFNNGIRLHNLSILKYMLVATKENPMLANSHDKWNVKIYGDGTELKFPPFFERILQRIQTYFSIYKYTDTSEVQSTVIPEENISLHVTLQPTNNQTTATDFSVPVAPFNDNSNKKTENTDLNHQHDLYFDIESTTQDDSNEFIAIDDNDNHFIAVGED